jgi:hypothetical protein
VRAEPGLHTYKGNKKSIQRHEHPEALSTFTCTNWSYRPAAIVSLTRFVFSSSQAHHTPQNSVPPLRSQPPRRQGNKSQGQQKKPKTYNSGYSLVVTHLTTNPPVRCLNRAERTGSLVFNVLWSYVKTTPNNWEYVFGWMSREAGEPIYHSTGTTLLHQRLVVSSTTEVSS